MYTVALILLVAILGVCASLLYFLCDAQSSTNSVDLIISRFEERLDWLDSIDLSRFRKVFVYNKGKSGIAYKSARVIGLPNVGRCDHTYLHHIITNYNNLATLNVFLPASCDLKNKMKRCEKVIQDAIEHHRSSFAETPPDADHRNELHDFRIDEWRSTHSRNSANDEKMLQCPERPFGKWYAKNFGDKPIRSLAWCGVFSASDKEIRNQTKGFYSKLTKYLDHHSNPEAGHYVERAWGAMFTT